MRKAPSTSAKQRSGSPEAMFGPIDPIVFRSVEYISPDKLTIMPGNPRVHSPANIEAIARAICATRVMMPIVVTSDSKVVAGEGRLAAARLLQLKTVPVLRASDLNEDQILTFRVADNRIGELSKFDDRRLAVALKNFSTRNLSFNIEHIGFKQADIDIRIGSLDQPIDPDGDAGDVLPDSPAVATSHPGYVWLAGQHRIICGSALERSIYEKLMRGGKARMSFQDPPYNVDQKHIGNNGTVKHRNFKMGCGELSDEEFTAFLAGSLQLTADHCTDGAVIMPCMDWRGIDKLLAAGKLVGLQLINLCVWNKSNASMGSLYRSKHELVAVFKKPGARHINNVMLGSYGRSRTNVWDVAGVNSFGKNRMEELSSHPTVKPVALVADAIRDVSNRGDIILDPFLGSGTTIIAAERTGRIGYGIELDPVYVDTAVLRWERFTGCEAVLEATGQTFAELAAERTRPAPPVSPRARQRFVPAA